MIGGEIHTYRIATPAVNQKFVRKVELRQVLCDQKMINVKTSALKHAIIKKTRRRNVSDISDFTRQLSQKMALISSTK